MYGTCDPMRYPLQKKDTSFEYLRTVAHMRPRTNTFQAVFRIRSLIAYAIHTFFMRLTIDATFLDKAGRVVKVVRNIPPGRFLVWGGWRAVSVLETASA